MSDLPPSFLEYLNRRGYNTFDKAEETLRHRQPWSYQQYQNSISDELLTGEEETIFSSDVVTSTVSAAAETTPLVATTAAASSSISTVGAITAGGVVAGTVLGAVLGSQLTVPGHHYLGPGNSIDEGKAPVDKDDARAQLHDEQYNSAKSDTDILNADKEFIVDSIPDIIKGDPHAIVGGVGISGKHLLESVLGVQYSGT